MERLLYKLQVGPGEASCIDISRVRVQIAYGQYSAEDEALGDGDGEGGH